MKLMKRLAFLITLLFVYIAISAQNKISDILNGDKQWTMRYKLVVAPELGDVIYYESIKLVGDTIIAGIPFKQEYTQERKAFSDVTNEWKPSEFYIGQDGEKIFEYSNVPKTIRLAYDFSHNIGDKVTITNFYDSKDPRYTFNIINISDSVLASSTDKLQRKCLYEQQDIWIEGIGSLSYGLRGALLCTYSGAKQTFVECRDKDNILYENPDAKTLDNECIQIKRPSNSISLFDLQGRRINGQPQKGMYIQNGKKFVK